MLRLAAYGLRIVVALCGLGIFCLQYIFFLYSYIGKRHPGYTKTRRTPAAASLAWGTFEMLWAQHINTNDKNTRRAFTLFVFDTFSFVSVLRNLTFGAMDPWRDAGP